MSLPPHLGAGLVAAAATATIDHLLRTRVVPGGRERWTRTNHRGDRVTLLEGVAVVAGSTLPLAWCDPAAAGVALGAGVTGALDDLHPDAARKGLTGHLGALVRGEVSGGALKIVGLLGSGLVGALPGARSRPLVHTGVRVALVAGCANLGNLLDLRPGRALKVALLLALPLARREHPEGAGLPAAAVLGAACVVLPADLQGRAMLGDTGANTVGALLGLSVARVGTARGRWVALTVVTALTLASERVSFTRVIEATPGLRELDAWGRPPR